MLAAGVDFVELGLRSLRNDGFKGACAFSTDEFIRSLAVPESLSVAVMINASELLTSASIEENLEKLMPNDASDSPVDLVRIACHVHEFERSLPASAWLKKRGYLVGFNIMQIAERTEAEVKALARAASAFPVDVLYFADSMGSMKPSQAAEIIRWLKNERVGALGIHTHDNLGLALSNTLRAIEEGVVWVDSTVTGMGRGPGNARTEELVAEISTLRTKPINMVPLMVLIRKYFRPMQQKYGWGTNVYYYLAGKYGIHPTYVQEMLADSRYSEEDILAVIGHLKDEGGAKYSSGKLNAARDFYQGLPQGDWCPAEVFEGRDVLLLGTGPGVENHREAIETYIGKYNPVVVALNTQSSIDASLIQYRIACHPVRLLADCEAHTRLPQPLITPYSMLPQDVKLALGNNKKVLDFGLNVKNGLFEFSSSFCAVPSSLVIAYAFAVLTSGCAKTIYLAGFDGYPGEDVRNLEMNNLIKTYLSSPASIPLVSITPTRYDVPSVSVYGL
ncbi:aldolase [Pseudomonas flexibilis]|nr:aldolase [Pseudomonas flexibilis]